MPNTEPTCPNCGAVLYWGQAHRCKETTYVQRVIVDVHQRDVVEYERDLAAARRHVEALVPLAELALDTFVGWNDGGGDDVESARHWLAETGGGAAGEKPSPSE